MKVLSIVCLAFILLTAPASAAERINLAAPDQARAGTMSYELVRLTFD